MMYTREKFIEKAKTYHKNKYDYSKVKYIDYDTKVCIICPEHGEFWQTPHNHLRSGCYYCSKNKKLTTEEFISHARKIHGDKYDYSKVEYKNAKTKIRIVCPIHGEFWQTPDKHLHGKGCDKCGGTATLTAEEFIMRAQNIHGEDYDYSLVKYVNSRTKILIKCCACSELFLQEPASHLNGSGCPHCKESKLEKSVEKILKEKNIIYEKQKKFEWLKNNGDLKLDFYLSDYNIAIECQGIQHYKPVDFGNKGVEFAEEEFRKTIIRDNIKKTLCEAHNVTVIYIKHDMTKDEKYSLIENILITNRRI